jgi:hypothetical protein
MSKKRWLVSILLIIVVALIVIGLLVYRRQYRAEPPLTISLNQYPQYVTAPTVVLRGNVSREARIELTRDTSSLGTVHSRNNEFQAEVELEPGENRIRLSARTVEVEPTLIETIAIIRWEPKNPPVPTINPLPATTNVPGMTISGATYSNGRVEIVISPDPEGTPFTYFQTAGKDGSFQTKVRLPTPGAYRVTSAAYNSSGVRSAASPDLKLVYDPDWYPPSNRVEAPKSRRITRKANIVLAHKRMTTTLEVTLPKDDPAVTGLLANRTSLDAFFHEIFGLLINNQHHRGEFYDVVPEIVIKDQDATITATTSPHVSARDYLPVLSGEFTLGGIRGFPFSQPEDSLSIRTYDYTIESIGPPPTAFEENTLTWIGSGTDFLTGSADIVSSGQSTREIRLQLAYKPFASPRNLLRLAQVSPYSFWRYPASAVPELLFGIYRLIPMLWVLWLVADSRLKNTLDAGLRNAFYRLAKLLITLSLVDTVFDVSIGLIFLGFRLRILVSPDTAYAIVVSFAILLAALMFELLIPRVSKRTWATWLTRASNGVRNAALIFILLGLTDFGHLSRLVTLIAGFTAIVLVLGVLLFRTAKVLKYGELTPEHRRRLTVLAAIVGLTFVVPLAEFGLDTIWITLQSFAMLQSVLPYALAIGLLIVLKNVNPLDQRRTRHLVLTIGLIIFSCFLVGTTPNLFMIPIPFILSIWVFKHLLVHDFRKCGDLDLVNKEVVNDRRRLIGDVLSYETAQRFQADIEKLKDKVTSGDMTLKEFEDRKSDIEKYAYDKELASTHVNGLHAKTTVLGIGPHTEDWRNGRWCLRWGAALIAPFLVAYLLLLLLRPTGFSESLFGLMFGFNQVLTFVVDWLLAAFFFGYYFRYIRGNSGLEKGLRTACAVIICLLPTWVTDVSTKTDLIGVFFRAGQTFLFFTLLGMGAFDYATFRNALRDQFRWRTFARFGNMPSFTAVVSVLITSIGVGLTSVVTGQFTDLLTNLLNAAFQQTPSPPP